jgi:hypothetical protein
VGDGAYTSGEGVGLAASRRLLEIVGRMDETCTDLVPFCSRRSPWCLMCDYEMCRMLRRARRF